MYGWLRFALGDQYVVYDHFGVFYFLYLNVNLVSKRAAKNLKKQWKKIQFWRTLVWLNKNPKIPINKKAIEVTTHKGIIIFLVSFLPEMVFGIKLVLQKCEAVFNIQ